MPFANDMLNLRREIDSLHAARMAMMHRLNRFRSDLRKNMSRNMSEMRKMFARESARARAARDAFNSHNREMVGTMIGGFGSERGAGHRNFFGKRA
ncbi:MAG TPA: hypothetical protein VEC38_04170 [Candidatus Binataceae bacterium]|nr:hypothetical protein [Candidatus Binataceae bacterium]